MEASSQLAIAISINLGAVFNEAQDSKLKALIVCQVIFMGHSEESHAI